MNRALIAAVLLLLALLGIQSTRLKTAQEARESSIVEWRTRGAEVRATRPMRAKKALAGASAAGAAAIAASAPESWLNSSVPEEIHAALRDFDGPLADGLRDSPALGPGAPD